MLKFALVLLLGFSVQAGNKASASTYKKLFQALRTASNNPRIKKNTDRLVYYLKKIPGDSEQKQSLICTIALGYRLNGSKTDYNKLKR